MAQQSFGGVAFEAVVVALFKGGIVIINVRVVIVDGIVVGINYILVDT